MRLPFRDHDQPDDRSRKGAELMELHAESTRTVQKLAEADAESKRVAQAVRNTVAAIRGGMG